MSALSRLAIAANCACAVWFSVAAYLGFAAPVPDTLFTKPTHWATATYEFPSPQGYQAGTGDHVSITISHSTYQANYYPGYYSGTKKIMTVRYGQRSYEVDISKLDQQLQYGSFSFSFACIQRPTNNERFNHLVVVIPWKKQYGTWKLVKFIGDYGGFEIVDYSGRDEALSICRY